METTPRERFFRRDGTQRQQGSRLVHWCRNILGSGDFGQAVLLFRKMLREIEENPKARKDLGCNSVPHLKKLVLTLDQQLLAKFGSSALPLLTRQISAASKAVFMSQVWRKRQGMGRKSP